MERRQFFYLAGLGTSTLLAGNLLTSCSKDDDDNDPNNPGPGTGGSNKITVDLSDPGNAALAAQGGSIIRNNVIIVHTTGSNYFALSKVCTHEGCTVGFDGAEIACPCHGSRFSTAGAVLQGPASSPLTKYATALNGNILTVTI